LIRIQLRRSYRKAVFASSRSANGFVIGIHAVITCSNQYKEIVVFEHEVVDAHRVFVVNIAVIGRFWS
jgi:hypothetical protein